MLYFSLVTAKLVSLLIRILKAGAGGTWPGHVVLKFNPRVLSSYTGRYGTRFVFVSGTNGKTTTVKLLSHILIKAGYSVVTNKSGANLLNGIVSGLLVGTPLFRGKGPDFAVFEVDEFTLPKVLGYVEPDLLLLLNLSRDQLDRYAEVDIVLDRWVESAMQLSGRTGLVIDSTQHNLRKISTKFPGKIFYFGESAELPCNVNLIGDFNAKNVSAAVVAAGVFGIAKSSCFDYLAGFDAAYGRGELVEYSGRMFSIFLAKNPVSFNKNLELINSGAVGYDAVLFLLNDDPRDGKDISWIYDIDPRKLESACREKEVFVGGVRYLDFSARLYYCGVRVHSGNLSPDIRGLITGVIRRGDLENILVLPNYSSMLRIRGILTGREIL